MAATVAGATVAGWRSAIGRSASSSAIAASGGRITCIAILAPSSAIPVSGGHIACSAIIALIVGAIGRAGGSAVIGTVARSTVNPTSRAATVATAMASRVAIAPAPRFGGAGSSAEGPMCRPTVARATSRGPRGAGTTAGRGAERPAEASLPVPEPGYGPQHRPDALRGWCRSARGSASGRVVSSRRSTTANRGRPTQRAGRRIPWSSRVSSRPSYFSLPSCWRVATPATESTTRTAPVSIRSAPASTAFSVPVRSSTSWVTIVPLGSTSMIESANIGDTEAIDALATTTMGTEIVDATTPTIGAPASSTGRPMHHLARMAGSDVGLGANVPRFAAPANPGGSRCGRTGARPCTGSKGRVRRPPST